MKKTRKLFTVKEDIMILNWVKKHNGVMKKCHLLAEQLGRPISSVSERYRDHLSFNKVKTLTEQQQFYIIHYEDEHKKKWAKLARKFGTTASIVKNYYYCQMRKFEKMKNKPLPEICLDIDLSWDIDFDNK
jgi:hypothetical protein